MFVATSSIFSRQFSEFITTWRIFAKLIGVNLRALQNWEQRRTRPSGPARVLLKIVASNPKSAIEALNAANRTALVVSLNATKEAIDAIKTGKLLASGEFSGYLQGCLGTMAAIRAVGGLSVPKEFNFPPRVIDRTNYQELDVPDAERQCPAWETVIKQ